MNTIPIRFGGHDLLLDSDGAVFWPAQRLLAVADLHLEKGTAAASKGSLLPPWDTKITLDRVETLLVRYRPATVVALGDSFHDRYGFSRMAPADAGRLLAWVEHIDFVWVLGNHDPVPAPGLAGLSTLCWSHLGLDFCHQARAGASQPELVGHHHPKATVPTRAGHVTRPCFVVDEHRLMLPAIGAFTGGLDVANPAISRLFPVGGRAYLLGRNRLFSFPLHHVAETA